MKQEEFLKKQVERTVSKEEAKRVIEKAGTELTDDEADAASGGNGTSFYLTCPNCGSLAINVCPNCGYNCADWFYNHR